jgi:hypothetical protein
MRALPKFMLKMFTPRCRHDPEMSIHTENGKLTEPGGEPRKVKMRMGYVKCKNCDQIFKMIPMGIVHDPVKEIYMRNEPKVQYFEIDPSVKKKLIKAIKAGGIS